jgi:glycosyltransferase involved in cell wall biosynthesis
VATQNPLPLSVAIITLNEENKLPRCLESLQGLAAEIVVIDSGSTDSTGEIAKQYGASFSFNPWRGHVAQKNIALRQCSQPWVLCVDADEVVSSELANSIRKLFADGEPEQTGFYVNRRTFYLGRWIWHAWYPEWRLRLVRKDQAEWRGLDPHDQLTVVGPTARLEGDLLHYALADLHDHFQNVISNSRTMADSYARSGKRFRWYYLVVWPWWDFFKHLVLRQGWRDGWRGWIISFMSMVGTFAKYAFLWEKQRADSDHCPP